MSEDCYCCKRGGEREKSRSRWRTEQPGKQCGYSGFGRSILTTVVIAGPTNRSGFLFSRGRGSPGKGGWIKVGGSWEGLKGG